eukprot:1409176-Rhodomonas_salina.2
MTCLCTGKRSGSERQRAIHIRGHVRKGRQMCSPPHQHRPPASRRLAAAIACVSVRPSHSTRALPEIKYRNPVGGGYLLPRDLSTHCTRLKGHVTAGHPSHRKADVGTGHRMAHQYWTSDTAEHFSAGHGIAHSTFIANRPQKHRGVVPISAEKVDEIHQPLREVAEVSVLIPHHHPLLIQHVQQLRVRRVVTHSPRIDATLLAAARPGSVRDIAP